MSSEFRGNSPKGGFRDTIGMRVVELDDGLAVMELAIGPETLNSHGSLHGGAIAAIIDNTGGLAGCYCHETRQIRKAVTLSLTTSFIGPALSGTIRAIGRKRSRTRRIFVSTVEVTDKNGNLIAVGEATYRYVGEERHQHGTP